MMMDALIDMDQEFTNVDWLDVFLQNSSLTSSATDDVATAVAMTDVPFTGNGFVGSHASTSSSTSSSSPPSSVPSDVAAAVFDNFSNDSPEQFVPSPTQVGGDSPEQFISSPTQVGGDRQSRAVHSQSYSGRW